MKHWFYFLLKKRSSVAKAQEELSSFYVEDLSVLSDTEKGQTFLCGQGDPSLFPIKWTYIEELIPLEQEINWEEQWHLFSPYYKDGLCKVPLSDFAPNSKQELILIPGPGFGDLSHPTTQLMMENLIDYVPNKVILDLGSGSGILGISALLFGANYAYCIDIDSAAVNHTQQNAEKNNQQEKLEAAFSLPTPTPHIDILLLNMTLSEQKQALSSIPRELLSSLMWMTSGILESQAKEYLEYISSFRMNVTATQKKEGWLFFVFSPEKQIISAETSA